MYNEVNSVTEIGAYIKAKRETAGYSQKKLATQCGISDSELHKIEKGIRKKPNWQSLCEIAKCLEIHPLELLLKAGYITEEDINPMHKIKRLNKLSLDELNLVQLYIDFLIAKKQGSLKGVSEYNDI